MTVSVFDSLTVLWVCLHSVIVVFNFPDHTHLLFGLLTGRFLLMQSEMPRPIQWNQTDSTKLAKAFPIARPWVICQRNWPHCRDHTCMSSKYKFRLERAIKRVLFLSGTGVISSLKI